MAATTELVLQAERNLAAIEGDLSDLPIWAAEWSAMSDGERASASLEWDHVIIDYLAELQAWQRVGLLTSEQGTRLGNIMQRLCESEPLLRRLRLHYPPPVTSVDSD